MFERRITSPLTWSQQQKKTKKTKKKHGPNTRRNTGGRWMKKPHSVDNSWLQNLETFEIELFEDLILYDLVFKGFSYSFINRKPDHSKSGHFVRISNSFSQKGGHLSEFQMVELPRFRSHLKSGPFATQPLFDHSKYQDRYCK